MPKIFQHFFVLVMFLTLALFAPSALQAQSTYTLNFDKASIDKFGLGNINWVQYNGLVTTDANGGVSVTFTDAADYRKWQGFSETGKIPEPSNSGTFPMPNQEIGGVSNTQGGSASAVSKPNQTTSIDTPSLSAPSLSGDITSPAESLGNVLNNTFNQGIIQNDIDNMFAAEMAGVDVEIAKINDELYGGNATGSGLTGVCANAGNIFKQIACKVMMFLIDLRVLAYIISGFGMVMFAWAAIFNKISWKHFSQIAIGLFMLSMIGPFITYFTGYTDIEKNLEYGNYLGGNYTPIQGAAKAQCPDGSSNCTPDTNTKSVNTQWSLKDLKGSIQSGLNLVRSGYNAYQGAKQVVQNVKTEAQNIGNAIKNSGGGLDGILDAASQVAGAANRLSFDVKTGVGGIAAQVSNAANAAQDITATNDQREERQNIRVNGAETGVKTTNAVSEWLSASGAGGQALSKVNQVTDTVGKAATGVGKATTAGHEGQKIGGNGGFGEVVGGIFAAGTAVGEGIGVYDQVQQENAVRQQQQQATKTASSGSGTSSTQQTAQQASQSASAQQQVTSKSTAIMNQAANNLTQQINAAQQQPYQQQQTAANQAVDNQMNNMITSSQSNQAKAQENAQADAERIRNIDNNPNANSNEIIMSDGTVKTLSENRGSNGSTVYEIYTDGSRTLKYQDGTVRMQNKDGTYQSIAPDGTVKYYDQDNKEISYEAYEKGKLSNNGIN